MPAIVSAVGMPVISVAGAAALSARHARDAASLDTAFQHLTAARLAVLEAELDVPASEAAPLLATAVLRRIAHRVLDKRASFGDVGAALAQHGWSGAVEAMKASAAGSNEALWSQVMEHEMTAYVPVQCQACGHRVPDETTPGNTDAEVGLSEAAPTAAEAPLVRGGWYRGPRGPVVFVLACPACGERSRWFRSAAASVTLNPRNWGRLCGEQEDLRAALAGHLGVPLRVAVPLDWDHVWSETLRDSGGDWRIFEHPGDAPAANFAGRLDEGIGAWSGVLCIAEEQANTRSG